MRFSAAFRTEILLISERFRLKVEALYAQKRQYWATRQTGGERQGFKAGALACGERLYEPRWRLNVTFLSSQAVWRHWDGVKVGDRWLLGACR